MTTTAVPPEMSSFVEAVRDLTGRLEATDEAIRTERAMLERDIDAGQLAVDGVEYEDRVAVVTALQQQAAEYRQRIDVALLTGIEPSAAGDLDSSPEGQAEPATPDDAATAEGVRDIEEQPAGEGSDPVQAPEPRSSPRKPKRPSLSARLPHLPKLSLLELVTCALIVACAGIILAFVGSSGGSSAHAGNPTSTPGGTAVSVYTKAQAGAAYLVAVQPVNNAHSAFVSQAVRWTSSTSDAQAVAAATTFRTAFTQVERSLISLSIDYPAASGPLLTDRRVAAIVNGQLAELSQLQRIGLRTWVTGYNADIERLIEDSDTVRTSLGLPPVFTGR